MGMSARKMRPALIGLCLLLAACGRAELYSKLTETQANEMIAVLHSAGIEATKNEAGENGWTLQTEKGDFSRAVEVLHSQGYPREEFASLGTVFKREGLVSSPTEEKARLVYGMSQELSHTISEIDGVVQARVHLVLPDNQPLAETGQPASASVFIKYRPGTNIDTQIGKVKALVVNSVQGLKYENVSVETFPAQPLPTVARKDGGEMLNANLIGVGIAGLLLLIAALGYPSLRRWQQRRAAVARREGGA
ncbi:type III secretion inner membrane ring lipoprotein SctJ [Sphingomonas sp. 7/4-4]|uniref:type III secretion system inner membrane ring lipoprotein SctJ n=1 Tax=Sphingomonas sp. 7/4-4 TaxID=3018446 RepID=UPI0022F3B101|nr:type III secretion inner membrane ring lipoprotein SctJ [Sphingomonas sp. 7/4-4]WBY09106.1 type III secretion inner membrane ring lipoprotein SctJ [Sphingomonas sp. 7/4-4]